MRTRDYIIIGVVVALIAIELFVFNQILFALIIFAILITVIVVKERRHKYSISAIDR